VASGLQVPAAKVVRVSRDEASRQRQGIPVPPASGQVAGAQERGPAPVVHGPRQVRRAQPGQLGPLGLHRRPGVRVEVLTGQGVQPFRQLRVTAGLGRGPGGQEGQLADLAPEPLALGGRQSGDVVAVRPPRLGRGVEREGIGPDAQ
jgi:hypothetical protein